MDRDKYLQSMQPDQLELFNEVGDFTLRVRIEDAMRIFIENYWKHLPYGKKSKAPCKKILLFFKGYYLDNISKADVERLRRFLLDSGYTPSYVNKVHMILGRLYTKWEEYRDGKYLNGTDLSRVILPNKNPASLVPRVKENPRKILINQAMKEHLCNLSVGVMRDFDLSVIIDCLWWTQLRQGDLFNIRPENVHLDAGTIIGIQNKTITTRNPSGNEYRVAIPPERIDVLKRRLSTSIPGKPIFLKTNLQKRWHFLREIAGYHNLQLRDLRGGATSELLDSNIDYETIRKKVGWKGYEMISWYDKRTGENIKNASRALVSVGEKEVDK